MLKKEKKGGKPGLGFRRAMLFQSIRPGEAARYAYKAGCLLVDLRSCEDYMQGHIPGAINVPYEDLEKQKGNLKPYLNVLYCDRGNTSLLASRDLTREGFRVINVCGGIHMYRGKIETGKP